MKKVVSNNTTQNDSFKGLINLLFLITTALVPFFALIGLIKEYSVNIPYQDDWDAVLDFLSTWSNSNFNQRIGLLFSQHNEHRILSSRIVYVLYNYLFHEVNFVGLIYIANAQLTIIVGILLYFSYKSLNILWGFGGGVVCFCLFDASSYENSNFAMAGMQNYGVIMLFLCSLFFYSIKQSKYSNLILAFLFQFFCAFSSGNGIIAGVALVFFALLTKDKRKIVFSIVGFLLFAIFYFVSYQSSGDKLSGINIFNSTSFFLKLSGGHFGFQYREMVSLLLFSILVFVIAFKLRKKIKYEQLPFLSVLLFVFLSMASIALFRSGGKEGIDHDSYASRYLIYPHILSAVTFIFILLLVEYKKIKWVIVGVCTLIFIKTYKNNYEYGVGGFERANNRLIYARYYYPDSSRAKNIAVDACNKHIYCIMDNRP